MTHYDKNGIQFITNTMLAEMMRGCNSRKLSTPTKSTSSNRKVRKGVTLGKLSELWPICK